MTEFIVVDGTVPNVVISAAGSAGVQGIQGTTGVQGAQGTVGIQGALGIQGGLGAQGIQGTVGVQGAIGTQGIQGGQGTLGSQGTTGLQGTTGTQGVQGNQGTTGVQGTQGLTGATGSQGTQGTIGIQGVTGSQGLQGDVGAQGTQGTLGLQGLSGIQGADGTQGTIGIQGTVGSQGIQGNLGLQGITGSQGTQGTQGVQGLLGIQGTQGLAIQGANGTGVNILGSYPTYAALVAAHPTGNPGDAYLVGDGQLYVWSATTNTWVDAGNIQGPQGTNGAQGTTGLQGITGAQGTQGLLGIQGIQGVVGSQGLTGSQGTEGATGAQGIQGTVGAQGVEGIQGSQGTQGNAGYVGSDGAQGTQGIQGIIGNQGTTGTDGSQGTTGTQGAVGSQGLTGIQGEIGSQGVTGIQGATGTQGTLGTQGVQGAIGTQGAIGSQGTLGTQGTQGLSIQGIQGITGNTGAGGALGYYGSFYDLTDQPLVSTTTAQVVAIGNTSEQNGVSIVNGDEITFAYAGTYSLTFSIQITNLANSVEKATFWLKTNNVDYPDSATEMDLQPRKSAGDPNRQVITINYVATATAGQQVQIYWSGTSTQLTIESFPAGTTPVSPAVPSIIVTAVQVMYAIQGTQGVQGVQGFGYAQLQGTQGIQGITGDTGAQGTTGADGAQGTQGTLGVQGLTGLQGTQGLIGTGTQGTQGTTGSVTNTPAKSVANFTATAGQTTFTTTYIVGYIDVYLNGARLADSDYTASDGTTVVLAVGATAGDNLDVVLYTMGLGAQGTTGLQGLTGTQGANGLQGTNGSNGAQGIQGLQGIQGGVTNAPAYTTSTQTATAGQTTFTVSYIVGYIQVFLNGVRLSDADFTATNGTSVVLGAGAVVGDVLDFVQVTLGLGAQGTTGAQGSIGAGTMQMWRKTMAGGETSLSGTDDFSTSLAYTVGAEQVFINGVLLERGVDYTASTGTTITALTALVASDVATVVSISSFSVADAIAKSTLTTTGDLLYASAASTPARLGVGSSSQVLTVSGGLPAWATPSASGMTLIQRSSFSGVANTGTTFDGIFSSTYSSYMVIIENWWAATSVDDMLMKLRIGSTTMALAYNGASIVTNNTTASIVTVSPANSDSFVLADQSGTATEPSRGQIIFPFMGTAGSCSYGGQISNNNASRYYNFNGTNYAQNAYTGLQFLSSSSNISGTISVYGLAKS
jgi:hypothetical protein